MIPATTVFLDRDGTIIRDVHYLARAADVELLPGAAAAIARLNDAGIPVVVVTNQSGIARGKLTVADYAATEARLSNLLANHSARIDATYYCPDHPEFSEDSSCRKPAPLLFERAAAEHGRDMSAPCYVGDRWRDIAVFSALGGTPVLIYGPDTRDADLDTAQKASVAIVDSLASAVAMILGPVPSRE
ncbi:MAG: HAD family hydrolase [Gemmatimonadota bacterium]|nr:HAD family hydrolase [Gemmatimonadota bacterium]